VPNKEHGFVVKDIVVNLSGAGPQDFAANYAVSVGASFGAHVVGISFVYDPVIPDGSLGGIPVDVIEVQRDENRKTANTVIERFKARAKAAGVSAETHVLEGSIGGGAALFGRIARRFDLAVIGQAQRERGASDEVIIEAALFETGRPLLVVPYIQKEGLKLDRVIVCWDGGRTAARAIADAMPFLERAKAVDVVVIAEERKEEEIAAANMIHHLARHGISASEKRMTKGDISIENIILSYAADSSADLLVMGGYGHSRWREFILGGVTRGILSSMTLPVLMSH
jgi:nucleotide-binding universal stress UspA family protein